MAREFGHPQIMSHYQVEVDIEKIDGPHNRSSFGGVVDWLSSLGADVSHHTVISAFDAYSEIPNEPKVKAIRESAFPILSIRFMSRLLLQRPNR